MADRPILILATGPRCGSTWLQRTLSSHPDIFIWGEHGGQLDPILTAADVFAAWSNNQAARANQEFETSGTAGFMANLAPSEPVLREQVHAMVSGLFHRLPAGPTVPASFRWGFKEIRYDAEFVRRFARYFPAVRVVYLTRDPLSVLRSLGWWERTSAGFWGRERTVSALTSWRDINASFLAALESGGPAGATSESSGPELAQVILPVRYEDLTKAREATLTKICHFLDVAEAELDHGVLDDVVHSPAPWGRQPRLLASRSEVVETYRELLDDPELIQVADKLGYSLSPATHAEV